MITPGAGERPQNVGILAADVYFPSTYVTQEDLEKANSVSPGKYTIGLGQDAMAFTGDREDINSVCLTVVAQLLEKYSIPRDRIGRLEVGTETLIDKSKSTKTVLMSLFEGTGNDDIEGVTTINACYGGTAALLNAVAWVECSGWDGRYAIVVAADIAVYAEGPARPTGGCGAVAMLIGPDAPLVVDMRTRASHACHVWDFFKPDMSSEYPEVNGQLSQTCYLRALDACYDRLASKKTKQKRGAMRASTSNGSSAAAIAIATANGCFGPSNGHENGSGSGGSPFVLADVQHVVCHSPYNKLVQKSFARMFFADARRLKHAGRALSGGSGEGLEEALGRWLSVPAEETYDDRELEKVLKGFAGVSSEAYRSLVEPGCRLSKKIGNTYAASVFANIVSLVDAHGSALEGQTALVFSYGSGAVATMYELHFRDTSADSANGAGAATVAESPFTIARIAEAVDLGARLADRERLPPAELDAALSARSEAHFLASSGGGFVPAFPLDRLFPGAYYLESVGADGVRGYGRRPPRDAAARARGGPMAPLLLRKSKEEKVVDDCGNGRGGGSGDVEEEMTDSTMTTASGTSVCGRRVAEVNGAPLAVTEEGGLVNAAVVVKANAAGAGDGTVAAVAVGKGARVIPALSRVVVTGVACGLPGQEKVFEEDNLEKLLEGKGCLSRLSVASKKALVEKNVVQVRRQPRGQPPLRIPITKESQTIKVAATLGTLDMALYGVSPSIAATMDKAVKVSVVAGLEALKDAGIVTGEGEGGWMLPGHMRDTTGVMYASSFPALDAAIGEVMRFLRSRCITRAKKGHLVAALRERLRAASPTDAVSSEDEEALRGLEKAVLTQSNIDLRCLDREAAEDEDGVIHYEFDRKFLFRVLVLGNAQLAQLVGARGPNMQTNAACAGSTLGVAMAQDMLQIGRCERMVLIAGDDASGEALLPWIGNGFRALGAASIVSDPADAALPFDARRNGMLLGAGGIGMVLETEGAAARRHCEAVGIRASQPPSPVGGAVMKARLLETQISNSAYHGASMDKHHIAIELERFLSAIHRNWGITREQIAREGVYFSHETCTHATPTASCSFNEVSALRKCFGEDLLSRMVIINTKGFTGHPMGVSFEDVAAVEALYRGVIPPTANTKTVDPTLGNLRLSPGGVYPAKYAMRFAAGFGSQVAFALYASVDAVEPMP